MARSIDADALYEVVSEHVTTVSVCPTVDWARGKSQMKEICLEDIANAPTVDAVPVRHGRWAHHKGGYSDHYECTVCGEGIVLTARFRYCPNCGAKMDGGETDGKS